jgi:uncharacterized protein (TIGR02246 family)
MTSRTLKSYSRLLHYGQSWEVKYMDPFPQADITTITSSIAAVRQAWLDAVRAGDAERLATMVTEDIVVVHGNGRCLRGRDELKADFLKGFEAFSIEQSVSSAEVVVRGRWAFEISEVESQLAPHRGGEPTHVRSTTIVALNQQSDGSWKVARVLGVLDAPITSSK